MISMKPEKLEQFILEARAGHTPEPEIRQALIIGGWDPVTIDAALQTATTTNKKVEHTINQEISRREPFFFPVFLTTFIIVLIAFNLVLYSPQIMGEDGATAVTNGELVVGVISSFIISVIIAGIISGIRKLFHKLKK
jgi:uncharacterized membrane protein (DUF485 family)